jgi:hypothetical protein
MKLSIVDSGTLPEVPLESASESTIVSPAKKPPTTHPSTKEKSLVVLQKDHLKKEMKKMDMEMELMELKKEKLWEEIILLKLERKRNMS